MGENGAGKSTLMKILSGAYHADPGGEILIDGQPVAITDPIAAKRAGIADHLPGAGAGAEPDGGREHAISAASRNRRGFVDREGDAGRRRPGAGAARRAVQPDHARRHAVDRRAPAGRDRPRAAREGAHPRHGRADHGRSPRARPSACSRSSASSGAEGMAIDLHQPPHGRGLRARRPRDGAARRRLRRHADPRRALAPTAWSR